jgi:hypothetical protein
MPYIIKKVKSGFKVCKKNKPSECYSKKGLTKKMAMKQRTAINLSELGLSKPMKGRGSVIVQGSYNGTPYAPIQNSKRLQGDGMISFKPKVIDVETESKIAVIDRDLRMTEENLKRALSFSRTKEEKKEQKNRYEPIIKELKTEKRNLLRK